MDLKKAIVYVVLTLAAASTALPCRCKLSPGQNGMIADCANLDLTSIPSCVLNDTTILDFSGNNVTELNTSLTSQKPALRQLIVHHSHVTFVSVNAFRLTPELRKLELAHNNLHQLPAGLFDATPLLEVLDLTGNILRSLPRGLLQKVRHLRRLDLTYNYLSILPGDLLGGCGEQASLRLGVNRLATLPAPLISSCSSMVELDLSSNKMTVLQLDVLAAIGRLPGLRTLQLQGNPWQCDCSLSPLAELLRTHESLDRELTCGGPPSSKDLHVVHAVSQLDCANLDEIPHPADHAPLRGQPAARANTRTTTIVVVVAMAACCTLAAVAAFFIKRHRNRRPVDTLSLVIAENS